jgi:G3E family GTPase
MRKPLQAEHFSSEVALSQLLYSDIILLNKADLVPEAKLTWLESYIQDTKEQARVLRCSLTAAADELPLSALLDVGLAEAPVLNLDGEDVQDTQTQSLPI